MDIVHHTVLLTPEAVALMNGASPWRRKLLVAIAIVTSMSRYVGAQTSLPAESLAAASRPPASIVSAAGRGGLRGAMPPMARAIAPSARGGIPRLRLPIATRPTGLATVEGNAVSSANAASNISVRLRDARNGKIVGSAVTDDTGKFIFGELNPGSYIAEILDQSQQQVVAASQLISANADQIATVSVKMPSKLSLLARAIGPTSPASTAISSQLVGNVATGVFQPPISER